MAQNSRLSESSTILALETEEMLKTFKEEEM